MIARGVLAVTILLFVPGLLDPCNAPRAMLLRVAGLPALAWALASVVLEPRSWAGTIRDRWTKHRAALALDASVAGWAIASLAATAWSVSPRLSVVGEIEQREGLLTTLGLTGLYALVRRSHWSPGHVRGTINAILVGAGAAAAYGLLQFAGHDPIQWGGTTRYPAGAEAVPRPFATLGNPILLGAVLAPALGIVTVRLATGAGSMARWSVLSGLLSVCLLTTLSRGAWLAGACGVATAVTGAAWLRLAPSPRRVVFALLAGAALPAMLALSFLRGPVVARVSESVSSPGSALARREIAHAALALWHTRPWSGTGPDTFGLTFPRVQTLAYGGGLWNGLPIHAHSVALQVLATTGLLGALFGLLWIAALAGNVWSRSSSPDGTRARLEIAAGCSSLIAFGALNPVGIAGACLFVALSAMMSSDGEQVGGLRSRLPSAAAIALALALAWSAGTELRAMAAAGRARSALQQSVDAPDAERRALVGTAATEAATSAARGGREDQLWRLSCESALAQGRQALRAKDLSGAEAAFERAETSARRALELEPLRATNFQSLGNALAMRASLALAARRPASEVAAFVTSSDSAFARGLALAPRSALILIDQARSELELHRSVGARATAERIVGMYPDAAEGYALLAAAELEMGDRAAAAGALRSAVHSRWMTDQGADERAAKEYLRALESSEVAH